MTISKIRNTPLRRTIWACYFPVLIAGMLVNGMCFHGYRPFRDGFIAWLERMSVFFMIGWDGLLIEDDDRIEA